MSREEARRNQRSLEAGGTRRLLTPEEAAEALAMSKRQVERHIHSGRIRAVKTGTRSRAVWRIPTEALDEYVASLPDNQVR